MELLTVILWTLAPFLELRASIPWGLLFTSLHPAIVILAAVVMNIILGWLIYWLLDPFVKFFLKVSWINTLWKKIIVRPRKKIQGYVDRYGELGVAIFIGIPLPGSGVYTAALGSYLLGVSQKKFMIATVIGVCIAAFLVSLVVLSGNEVFSWVVKS